MAHMQISTRMVCLSYLALYWYLVSWFCVGVMIVVMMMRSVTDMEVAMEKVEVVGRRGRGGGIGFWRCYRGVNGLLCTWCYSIF